MIMHFFVVSCLPHVAHAVPHCLRFNPVVAAYEKAHHLVVSCLG
jgi:hypothetical protein